MLSFLHFTDILCQSTTVINQSPLNIIINQKQSAKIQCHQSATKTYMYWYRQQSTNELQLVVYSPYNSLPEYDDNLPKRFNATRSALEKIILSIENVQTIDTGFYLCAASDTVKGHTESLM
ncbi:TVB72 protein, partial [Polypterus senegalus]